LVTNRLVVVALVVVAFEIVAFVAFKIASVPLVTLSVVKMPDVDDTKLAIKFVVVTVPKLPFQRSADEPSESVASTFGLRLV